MPLKIKKIDNKYRLVEPDGKIAKTSKGHPVDGGGHESESAAKKQVSAIEISKHKTNILLNSYSTGEYYIENIGDRDHLVTKMLAIKGDSIMNDLFYPADEVKSSHQQIDYLPAPVGHPKIYGQNVSANFPLAINRHYIGAFCRNPTMEDNSLINELVIDLTLANNDDRGKKLVDTIKGKGTIGVSTGLTANITNEQGDGYKGTVRDIKFDHVALLMDEEPAGKETYVLNEDASKDSDEMKHEIDLSPLSEEDRQKIKVLNAKGIIDLINKKPDFNEAKDIVESKGYFVNKIDNNQYEEWTTNQLEYQAWKKERNSELDKIKKDIIANSEFEMEELDSMSDSQLKRISALTRPTHNYSVQNSQGITNKSQKSTSQMELHKEV